MRIRHKVPAIFSLSMVDMLCCALGCVILIWLLNAKQSEDEAEERREETEKILAGARADREASQRLLAEARTAHSQATERVRALMGDREKAAGLIARLEERIRLLEESEKSLKKLLGGEQEQAKTLAANLKEAKGRIGALEADVRGAQEKNADLNRTLAALRKSYNAEKDRADALNKTVATRQKELLSLEVDLDKAKEARLSLEKSLASRDRDLEAAAAREKGLEKQVKDRQAALTKLEKDNREALDDAMKKVLALTKDRADARAAAARQEKDSQAAVEALNQRLARAEKEKVQLRLAAENRFAGITLTGRRVIFLIDASGSMVWVDEKTKAPEKWTEVCATVSKLMRSLPDLEKFQVITFNRGVAYPLGNDGRWIDYNPRYSADQAERALTAVTPKGGTNMYSATDATFRFRRLGLDTVYFLSDGLPNEGEGLEEAKKKGLKEGVEQSDFLGKKVRAMLRTDWNRPLAEQPRVKVNTIGFFYESPDLGAFLWALARENDGSFVGMSRP